MKITKQNSHKYNFLQIQGLNSLPHVVLYGKDRLEFSASSSSASPSAQKAALSIFFVFFLYFFYALSCSCEVFGCDVLGMCLCVRET